MGSLGLQGEKMETEARLKESKANLDHFRPEVDHLNKVVQSLKGELTSERKALVEAW